MHDVNISKNGQKTLKKNTEYSNQQQQDSFEKVQATLAYRKYSKDYVNDEEEAKEKKIGLWAGEFIPPWEWRRLKR